MCHQVADVLMCRQVVPSGGAVSGLAGSEQRSVPAHHTVHDWEDQQPDSAACLRLRSANGDNRKHDTHTFSHSNVFFLVHSFIRSFIRSFIHSFIHSFIRLFVSSYLVNLSFILSNVSPFFFYSELNQPFVQDRAASDNFSVPRRNHRPAVFRMQLGHATLSDSRDATATSARVA